jgi:hypothetical protein
MGLLVAAAAATGATSPAHAGTYSVWYCFDANDKPVVGAERDWYGSSSGLGY